MIFTYTEAKKKDVIKILTDRYTFYKVTGSHYTPGDRVHIGLQNYLVQFNGETLALLQIDKFSNNVPLIHGCVLPKYCKSKTVQLLGLDMIELIKATSNFNKIVAPTPENAKHAGNFLKSIGFEEEARIKDGVTYGGQVQDYIIYSYTITRGDE
jgi:hypothetical protein